MKRFTGAEFRRDQTQLTAPVKRALLLLLDHGKAFLNRSSWSAGNGSSIHGNVMEAAFDRRLVVAVFESRHRTRPFVELSEIGLHVARDLRHEEIEASIYRGGARMISAEASIMIQSALDPAA